MNACHKPSLGRLFFFCSFFLVLIFMGTGKILAETGKKESARVFHAAAKPLAAGEVPGERPYEMVMAKRQPAHVPLVNFDSLSGWKLEGKNGGAGELSESVRQRLWESTVARLSYRGQSKESEIRLLPPRPISIPEPVSAVTLWVYGNNWGWEPDPSTPQVELSLLLQNSSGEMLTLKMDSVRWKEWWLIHRILPSDWKTKRPLRFAGIQIRGCANKQDRELYFEDLAFFQESPRPISFEPRPQRGIDMFPGQAVGANSGPGRLPFPTREETILPENLTKEFRTMVEQNGPNNLFRYKGSDGVVEYTVSTVQPFFRGIEVRIDGKRVGRAWSGAGVEFGEEPRRIELLGAKREGEVLTAAWKVLLSSGEARVDMACRLWQKSLVLDVICPDGKAKALSYGTIQEVPAPELILLPFMNYGGHHLNVLMGKGTQPFFASVWMDWYRSNASEPYALDKIKQGIVQLNGGVRYLPTTDGKRNGLFERAFLTFSKSFEETLPTIPNPPAARGKEAGTRLWQESWGPKDYAVEQSRSRKLRAYGIEMLTQCNHEITWRNEGESFTFRTMASPAKGGDAALQKYVEAQKALGWRSGLYTNYTDYAPVNAFWDPDMVMRDGKGDLIRAWPRCYSPKALFAVEMDRQLAPKIVEKYKSNAAYTDVHTSVSPWERCDYDVRVPGAGTFAATFYAYGELLLHDQSVYDGHCWSEGNHQWLYAGLTTGNYGLTYSGLKLWKYPYLPHFDLLKMHPLTVDIGVPWTAQFFHDNKIWDKPGNIVKSIDQFIAATIAYGHMGWLVEEQHGIRQACRSYYSLQQLQSRYLMEKPETIRYSGAKGLISSSEAFLSGEWKRSQLQIRYENGLEVWVNGNKKENWSLDLNGKRYLLPPFGWLAIQGEEFLSGSLLEGGRRYDRVSSSAYIFLDGRGTYRELDGLGSDGSVAARPLPAGEGLSIIVIDGASRLVLSPLKSPFGLDDVRAVISRLNEASQLQIQAFDVDGKMVGEKLLPRVPQGGKWIIPLFVGGIRYDIRSVAP